MFLPCRAGRPPQSALVSCCAQDRWIVNLSHCFSQLLSTIDIFFIYAPDLSLRMPRTIEVGYRYMVEWRNGPKHVAEVIEVRSRNRKRDRDQLASSSSEASNEDFEYYVHYINFDRRMDEWVTVDRMDLDTPVPGAPTEQSEHKTKKAKRRADEGSVDSRRDEKEALLQTLERENEEITKVKNIRCIVLGAYEVATWYYSPYPDELAGEEKLYICEFCLKYMKNRKTFLSHCAKCPMQSPPGQLIYLDPQPGSRVSMFEIDGREHKLYCQNLCLLSKLFLDHKTLYYDVDPFLFYVLCEQDEGGGGAHHIVGYFSKEKQSAEQYNLACILTFPPFQRKGYGKLLISISYELTRREGGVGSPEKPLSDLGRISYRSYWAFVLLRLFQEHDQARSLSVERMSRLTGIRTEDILSTCHSLGLVKYWKGQHVVA
ncbi:hypothetical protein EON64_13275, partial [archaeon]